MFDRVTFQCVAFQGTKQRTFTDGAFKADGYQGSKFIPTAPLPPGSPGFDINNFLDIQWCPNQNWFLVTIAGVTYILRSIRAVEGGRGSGVVTARNQPTKP